MSKDSDEGTPPASKSRKETETLEEATGSHHYHMLASLTEQSQHQHSIDAMSPIEEEAAILNICTLTRADDDVKSSKARKDSNKLLQI